jgi:hypothetical protein
VGQAIISIVLKSSSGHVREAFSSNCRFNIATDNLKDNQIQKGKFRVEERRHIFV